MKMRTTAFLLWISSIPVFSEWILMEDFSQYSEGDAINIPYNGPENFWSLIDALLDPGNTSETVGMVSGWPTGYRGDGFFNFALPAVTEERAHSTIFLRFFRAQGALYFGVSDAPSPSAGQNGWVDMQITVRAEHVSDNPENPTKLQVRGDEKYLDLDEPFYLLNRAWYKMWIVIHNASGYTVYLQGPDERSPKRLNWGQAKLSTVPFRNPLNTNPFRTFVVALSVGLPVWLLDDIYFANQACLSDPTEEGFCSS
jgi:hypothetical protein